MLPFVGSFLEHEFEGHVEITPTLQLTMISKPDATYLVDKHSRWSHALLRDVQSCEETRLNGLPGGWVGSACVHCERMYVRVGVDSGVAAHAGMISL